MLLHNQNAVIYGGGGAIGGAVAQVFAKEGARVFIAGRTLARLDAVAADIAAAGGTAETAQKEAFSRVLAQELAPRNIRVICIRPHAIAHA
jgi:NAD(P)-dependent dehydrogenase (short-subunit alcohol dehydrogenase family)